MIDRREKSLTIPAPRATFEESNELRIVGSIRCREQKPSTELISWNYRFD